MKAKSGSGIVNIGQPEEVAEDRYRVVDAKRLLYEQLGEYVFTLTATNSRGSMQQAFKIVVGDTLALTPPMGWNSWYIHYSRVTDGHMRRAADLHR